jgi:hypothetical protein
LNISPHIDMETVTTILNLHCHSQNKIASNQPIMINNLPSGAHLEKFKPATVKVTSLLEKRTEKSSGFKGDFIGFSIPDVRLG